MRVLVLVMMTFCLVWPWLHGRALAMGMIPVSEQCRSLEALDREWRGQTSAQRRERSRYLAWYNKYCRIKGG